MHIISMCVNCKEDFMYHESDIHLCRKTKDDFEIEKNYPLLDDTWPSRRWNKDKDDYQDLSGGFDVICQNCHDKERYAHLIIEFDFDDRYGYKYITDNNTSYLCAMKGCPDMCLEFSKYCFSCYDEHYPHRYFN